MNYTQWLSEWQKSYVRTTVKQKTFNDYSSLIKNHIVPRLGRYELDQLTPLLLQKFVSELTESGNLKNGKGLSASTVKIIISVLRSSLRTAYSVGMCREYTADRIITPRLRERSVVSLTVKEQMKIENYILKGDDSRLAGILICLHTGLRIGELLALTWNDVDLEKMSINVNKTCQYHSKCKANGKRAVNSPKTESSVRTIPISEKLKVLLDDMKKKSRSIYVISNGENYMSIRTYQRLFAVMLKRLNIPVRGFHTTRHTFATRAIESNMDVKTLSELLGHKSSVITLNRYVHSSEDRKKEMMERLSKYIGTDVQ